DQAGGRELLHDPAGSDRPRDDLRHLPALAVLARAVLLPPGILRAERGAVGVDALLGALEACGLERRGDAHDDPIAPDDRADEARDPPLRAPLDRALQGEHL